jgi:hypothetical protein
MSEFDPRRPFQVVAPEQDEQDEPQSFDPSRPFQVVPSEGAESTRTRASDIARGMGAGAVGLGQGIAELGALGLDTLLDTDYSRPTTEFFVGAKNAMGLDPETTAGQAAEAITNFGLAFVPIAGWLGRAGQVAQGAKAIGQGGRFSRSAEAFGASGTGRALVGSRARLAGTTTLAAGVSDLFVSPEGMGTLADAFDALPDILRTEEDTGLTGRDEAFRRLRNKIRVGAEGSAFGAAFEALFPVARVTAQALAQVPGVPTAAGTIVRGMEALGDKLAQVPGVQKYLTSRGLTPQELSFGVESAEALTRTQRTEAEQSLIAFEKAAKELAPNLLERIRGNGREGYDKLYDDLFRFLQGTDDALGEYGESIVKPASQMRDQITRMSTVISDQVANSNLSPEMKAQILDTFQNNMGGYVRRLYQKFENPETWTVDAGLTGSPTFKRAVDEVQRVFEDMDRARVRAGDIVEVRPLDAVRVDAEQEVKRLIGLDAMDTGLTDDALLALRGTKVAEGQKQFAGRPLYNIAEGLLQERSKLLDRSPSLRELLGEIKDPKQAYLRTVDDMSRVIAGNKLYDQTLQQYGKTGAEALQMLNQSQGRAIPLVIYGADADQVGQELMRSRGYVQLGEPRTDTVFGGSYGQMTGAYVAPEIYSALTTPQQMTQGFLNEALALALQAKGAAQAAKTVYSPITQVRNFISGAFLTMANGNLMRGMPFWDSLHLTAGKSAGLGDADFRQLYELTGNLGLRDQNITVNEFRNLLREGSDLSVAGRTEKLGRTVMEKVPFARSLERLYSGSDTFWKITNWNAERAKYANAFRRAGLAPDAIDQIGDALVRSGLGTRTSELTGTASYLDTLAGDIVKNTQPIYSRVPEAVKMIRRIPVVGNFVAFPAEVLRNTANIFDQGLREMSFRAGDDLVARIGPEAAQKLERQIRAIGAQRLSGYVASATAVPAGIQAASARVLGWDQEGGPTMRDLQKIAPDYMKGHQLVPISEAGNPDVEFIDLSYMMPYDFVMAPARAALQLYSETGDVGEGQAAQLRNAAFAGLGKLFEPFAGESLVGERLANVTVRGGQTPTGSPIFTENTPFGEKISRGFTHVAGAYIPGALEMFVQERRGQLAPGRVTRAGMGIPSPAGQEFNLQEEGAALVTGLRPMQARLNETFSYRGFEYNQARRDATSVFSQVANANDSTEQDVIRAYERANAQLRSGQARLLDLVETGRRLGMSDRAIRQQLVDVARLGRREVANIMRGRFDPLGVSDDRVKAVLREGRTQARVITRLPTRELRSLERQYSRERLIPQDFTAPSAPGFDPSRPFQTVPQTQRAASAAPVVAPVPAPAVPQTPQAPARTAPPSPALLGTDPISQARNAEIAQRLSNQ